MSSIILTTTDPCVAHAEHEPEPTYCEEHHVVVQAWQAFWQPPLPWPNAGKSRHSGLLLWDARTDALCRTGHGNVHHWLVQAMREYETAPGEDGSDARINAAWVTVKRQAASAHIRWGRADVTIAKQAMVRFRDAGGSLLALCEAGLYGEI